MGQNHSNNNLRSSGSGTPETSPRPIKPIKKLLKKSSSVSIFDLQASDSATIGTAA